VVFEPKHHKLTDFSPYIYIYTDSLAQNTTSSLVRTSQTRTQTTNLLTHYIYSITNLLTRFNICSKHYKLTDLLVKVTKSNWHYKLTDPLQRFASNITNSNTHHKLTDWLLTDVFVKNITNSNSHHKLTRSKHHNSNRHYKLTDSLPNICSNDHKLTDWPLEKKTRSSLTNLLTRCRHPAYPLLCCHLD